MSNLKNPLFSLGARGSLGKAISFVRRRGQDIAEKKPEIKDVKSPAQLSWRHMYQKCAALWHTLSVAEQADWNSLGGVRHMTGFAYWQSQCLRPNPGIYLPLQGGTMQGIIDMDGYAIQDLLDPVAPQDADTEAARDAAIAAAIGGSLTCDIYGWDGLAWQKLLTESAAFHNLRVKLFDGDAGIDSSLLSADWIANTKRCVLSICAPYLYGTAASRWYRLLNAQSLVDNNSGTSLLPAGLYTFDGTLWDRLRSYVTGILKVGRAEIPSTTTRVILPGLVAAGAHDLYWVACSPDAPAAEWQLTDAIAGGGAVVYDHFDNDKHSEQITFDPPIKFATGIWVEKFDHMLSLTFCYI
ncbi:hypothetical protein ES703_80366 [subsurface metagenome]